jgi:hypothetical protein
MNLGEVYLDHYDRFLRRGPTERWAFGAGGPTLQVLAYDGIFKGCRVFATLGLTHFRERLGTIVEVVAVADDGLADVPHVLGSACLYLATEGQGFARGHAMSGLENIDARFVRKFKKSAIYFCGHQGFPVEFGTVCAVPEHGVVTAAIFITAAEFKALGALGPKRFEQVLAEQSVDPFALGRESARLPGPGSHLQPPA